MPPDLFELPVAVVSGHSAVAVPRLPHAPPFRLLDRVLHVDLQQGTLWAQKQVTANDALWPAEQSLLPIAPQTLPSLLLIEALSQAAACFNLLSSQQPTHSHSPAPSTQSSIGPPHHLGFLVSVSDFRFPEAEEGAASVGDTVLLHVQKQESLGALVAFSAQALCPISPTSQARASDVPRGGAVLAPSATDVGGRQARALGQGRLLFAVTSK